VRIKTPVLCRRKEVALMLLCTRLVPRLVREWKRASRLYSFA
jgi:hypothetical protein